MEAAVFGRGVRSSCIKSQGDSSQASREEISQGEAKPGHAWDQWKRDRQETDSSRSQGITTQTHFS